MDDGIRGHHHDWVGFPFSAYYFGPFLALLQAAPVETIGLVNRMLDHAGRLAAYRVVDFQSPAAPAPAELTLPYVGARALHGNPNCWLWYRGTSFAPYPCTSALLAIEHEIDRWFEMGVTAEVILRRLLENCNNLSMVGLVVGFLERHIDTLGHELDAFLAQPVAWELEFRKQTGEVSPLRAQRDDKTVVGAEYRTWSFRDVSVFLTGAAISTGDEQRIAELEAIADTVDEAARGPDDVVDPTVRLWTSALRASSYEQVNLGGGVTGLQAKPPADVAESLAEQQRALELTNEGYRLLNTYGETYIGEPVRRPADLSRLASDVAVARRIVEELPLGHDLVAMNAPAAVAAAAIVAVATGEAELSDDDLSWAGGELLYWGDPEVRLPGADRFSADGLPMLLAPAFHEAAEEPLGPDDVSAIVAAIERLTTSPHEAVRQVAAAAMAPIWTAPCHLVHDGACRHQLLFACVESGVRDCRFGSWGPSRRELQLIDGNVLEELPTVAGKDLRLNFLTAPIVSLAGALGAQCCVAHAAEALLDQVLAAQSRALVAYGGEGYEVRDEGQLPVIEALVDLQERGYKKLDRHLLATLDDPAAAWQQFRLLAQVATYDESRRGVILGIWPELAHKALDEIEAGRDVRRTGTRRSSYRRSDAIGAIVPRPQLAIADTNPDATLEAASAEWIELAQVRPIVERWVPLVVGLREAIDDLVTYLRTLPLAEQVDPGLAWINRIVSGHYELRSFMLPTWLRELQAAGAVSPPSATLYRSIVDGFAHSGDRRFVVIQTIEEGGVDDE